MKRQYNQPTCVVVALSTCHMMAESLEVHRGGAEKTITSSEEILTKENRNIWDEEW